MRILIQCAGGGNRWGDFCGVPKHLATMCGERLLDRTVRLCREYAPDADVRIVVRDLSVDGYKIPGARRATARFRDGAGDANKLASTTHLWSTSGPTVLLYGDVWWHEDTLAELLTAPIVDGWHAWFRLAGDGGELFAFAWTPDAHGHLDAAIDRVAGLYEAGGLDRGGFEDGPIPAGWAIYRALAGADLADHADHGHSTLVDDGWTDDLDTPADWHHWCYRWATTPADQRPPMGG